MSEQTPSDLAAQVIARAWKDEAFKEDLLRDPTAVVARELAQLQPGATLPANVQIQVLEETPTTHYLVLPAKPAIDSGDELTDADLQRVVAASNTIRPSTTTSGDGPSSCLLTYGCRMF